MIEKFKSAMDGMHSRYSKILSHYYPAHKATGFTERNLTNNFVYALEQSLGEESFSWFEAPICLDDNKHIDAVFFYKNVTILIEAKRFTSTASQSESVRRDLVRMHSRKTIEILEDGLDIKEERIRYSVVLADVWTETPAKTEIFDNWPSCISHESGDSFTYSDTVEFLHFGSDKPWMKNYKLLIAVTKIDI